jgi:hypothetical protein
MHLVELSVMEQRYQAVRQAPFPGQLRPNRLLRAILGRRTSPNSVMLPGLVAPVPEHARLSQRDNVMLRVLAVTRVFARSARTGLMVSKGRCRR